MVMPPPKTAAEMRAYYDSLAPSYNRNLHLIERTLGIWRHRADLYARVSGDVLDVACGTGQNFPHFPPTARVTAVDLSPGMVAQAQARAAALGRDITTHVMDAETLDFPDASFDFVTSALATCSFPHPVNAVREMGRVCRPGGRVLLLEHGRSTWGVLNAVLDRAAPGDYRSTGCRLNNDPLRVLREAGLTLLSARRALLGIIYVLEAMHSPVEA